MNILSKIKRAISDFFYEISVKIHRFKKIKKQVNGRRRINDLVFCLVLLIWPTLQFGVFYIGTNFNSVLLAFRSYAHGEGYSWVGFSNFTKILNEISTQELMQISIKNSFLIFVISLMVSTTLTLIFSYFIYKKVIGYRIFRVILFLPSIVSSIVIIIVYRYFVENGVPIIAEKLFDVKIEGLFSDPQYAFGIVLFKTLWFSFGGNLLIYLGAMGGINPSVIEAGELDGCTYMQEFAHIVFPLIYPTFTTFFVMGLASLFTAQMDLFAFYGTLADDKMYNIGYYLYIKTFNAGTNLADYPYLAAFGLLLTAVTVPLTLIVKHVMEKLGPSVD